MGRRSWDRGEFPEGRHTRTALSLQWGRGLGTAESARANALARGVHLASMGPRSWDRGERWTTAIRPASPAMLQWGRGLGTAERSRLLLKGAKAETLQWGRGIGAAESEKRRGRVHACGAI